MPLQKKPTERGNLKVRTSVCFVYLLLPLTHNPPYLFFGLAFTCPHNPPIPFNTSKTQVKFNVLFPQLNEAQKRAVKQALAGATYPSAPQSPRG